MNRYALVALVFVVLLDACGGNDESSKSAKAGTYPDAANAAYLIEGKTIILVNGKADEPAAPGSASRNVTTLTSFTGAGDVDGDAKSDLAVILTNSPSGSGNFYYVAALASSGRAPWMALLLGDRITISQVSVKPGTVTVSYLTRPAGAPFSATPSVPESKTFSLGAGQLKPN
jgi:hypothetical protein